MGEPDKQSAPMAEGLKIQGRSVGEYLQLPDRERVKLLKQLDRQIFGRDPGLRTLIRREPPRDAAWVPILTALIQNEPNVYLLQMIAHSLARIQSPNAIPGLVTALGIDRPDVQRWGAWGLGQLRAGEAVPALGPLLYRKATRDLAGEALVLIGSQPALLVLNEAANKLEGSAKTDLETFVAQLRRKLAGQ